MCLQCRRVDAGLRADSSAATFGRFAALGAGRHLPDDLRYQHRLLSFRLAAMPAVDRRLLVPQFADEHHQRVARYLHTRLPRQRRMAHHHHVSRVGRHDTQPAWRLQPAAAATP